MNTTEYREGMNKLGQTKFQIQSSALRDNKIIFYLKFDIKLGDRCIAWECEQWKKHSFHIPPDKFGYPHIIFLVSPQKNMLWVLIRSASPRRF